MTPTVYVGIPTRNRPEFVRNALRSVLAQTYIHLRVLVTDNDSPPAVADDVRKFVEQLADARVSYVFNPVAEGERGQTLYNFSRCEEPYFLLLHDDDQLHPTLIERAVEALETEPQLAFFCCAQNLIDDQGAALPADSARYNRLVGRHRLANGVIDNVLEVTLRGGAFSMSGTLFRHSTMARVGFVDADGGGFPIDVITFLRIGEGQHKGYFTNECLVDYRRHAGQASVEHAHWSFNEWMVEKYIKQLEVRRFHGRAEQLRRHMLCVSLCRLAIVRHVAQDTSTARMLFRRALAVSPRTWQAWAYCLIGHLLPFVIVPNWGRLVTLKRQPA